MSLYKLTNEFRSLVTSDDSDDVIIGQLEALELTLNEKLANCCAYYKTLEAEAEMFKAEEKRLKTDRDRLESKAERFKNYMQSCLGADANASWKDGVHSLKYRKSESVEINFLEVIPEVYLRKKTIIEADKSEIKLVLKSGGSVSGAELKTNFNLQIK